MKRGIGWPIGIAVTLGLLVAAYVRVAMLAGTAHALVVESDYYQKAVHWDDAMRQARVNAALGWTVSASLGDVRPGADTDVRVQLNDATGAPVIGARVEVTAIHNAIANEPVRGLLREGGPGTYGARLPVKRTGQWELRLGVTRGKDRFTADLRLDASGAASRS